MTTSGPARPASQVTLKTVFTVCFGVLAITALVFFLQRTQVSVTLSLGAGMLAVAMNHAAEALIRRGLPRNVAARSPRRMRPLHRTAPAGVGGAAAPAARVAGAGRKETNGGPRAVAAVVAEEHRRQPRPARPRCGVPRVGEGKSATRRRTRCGLRQSWA